MPRIEKSHTASQGTNKGEGCDISNTTNKQPITLSEGKTGPMAKRKVRIKRMKSFAPLMCGVCGEEIKLREEYVDMHTYYFCHLRCEYDGWIKEEKRKTKMR